MIEGSAQEGVHSPTFTITISRTFVRKLPPHGSSTVPPWILTKTVQRYFVKSHTQEDTNYSVTWQIAAHLCHSTLFSHRCFHSECHFYLILNLLSNYWLLNGICQIYWPFFHICHGSHQRLFIFLGFPRSWWGGTPNKSTFSFHKMKNERIKSWNFILILQIGVAISKRLFNRI